MARNHLRDRPTSTALWHAKDEILGESSAIGKRLCRKWEHERLFSYGLSYDSVVLPLYRITQSRRRGPRSRATVSERIAGLSKALAREVLRDGSRPGSSLRAIGLFGASPVETTGGANAPGETVRGCGPIVRADWGCSALALRRASGKNQLRATPGPGGRAELVEPTKKGAGHWGQSPLWSLPLSFGQAVVPEGEDFRPTRKTGDFTIHA